MRINRTKTERGFTLLRFNDRYDHPCSIQKSSLAFEDAIWIGIDDAKPQILQPEVGWVSYPVPKEVLLHTRMHLTRNQVAKLLPILQKFVEEGKI